MLLPLALALLAQSLQARPTGPARLSDNQLQSRDYVPSTSADLIPLGLASNYAVFTFTGISTVAGTVANGNVVNGDIGVAPIAITAITGFGAVKEGASNTPFVTGYIHAPPYTAIAHDDVIHAYNTAAGKTPSGAIVTGAGTLDDGVPMTPGVYRWTGALALGVGKTLTLNGACGDIFIFQTAGAITTGANSKVVLTGGLTAASVYWVSATSLSTGVASSFSGIILTGTNVVIAGTLVGAVYAQTETALHSASISAPTVGLAATQIGSVCNVANCPVNTQFSNGACSPCASGSVSTGGSSSCVACSGANYLDSSTGACTPCSEGTVSCDLQTGHAISCSPGYSGTSTSSCAVCSKGSFAPGGSVSSQDNACKVCAAGFYAPSDKSSTCTACTGNYNTCDKITGKSLTCPAGTGLSSESICTACTAGYYSKGDTPCTACPGGNTWSNIGAIACVSCASDVGRVEDGKSQLNDQCLPTSGVPTGCNAGYGVGGSFGLECVPCSGIQGSNGGGGACIECPDLSFSRNGVCAPCLSGTISCAKDTGSGISCNAGYGSNGGANSCTLCNPGAVSVEGSTTCTACTGVTFASGSPATCVKSSDVYAATVDPVTGTSSTCVTNYSINSKGVCATGFYARFLNYEAQASDIQTSGLPESNSEGACAQFCATVPNADHFTFGSGLQGRNCYCKSNEETSLVMRSNNRFISNVIGTCANLQYSKRLDTTYDNCQDIVFAADGSCSAANGGPCSCQDPFAKSCDAITGLSTSCVAGQGPSNGECIPCVAGTFNYGGFNSCRPCNPDPHATACDRFLGFSTRCFPGYGLTDYQCRLCPVNTFNRGDISTCRPSNDPLSATIDGRTGATLTCAANAYGPSQSTAQCVACPSGTQSPVGSTSSSQCSYSPVKVVPQTRP